MTRKIICEEADGIATITMQGYNHYNPLTTPMLEELARLFDSLDRRADIKVAILRGAGGRNFSAGADLKEGAEAQGKGRTAGNLQGYSGEQGLAQERHDFWFSREHSPLTVRMQLNSSFSATPVVAAVQGVCLAAALMLLFHRTTIRIAATDSLFCFSEIHFGAGGTVSVTQLARGLPKAAAAWLSLGEYVDAQMALRVGLVNELVAPERVDERALEVARMIARQPRVCLAAEKRPLVDSVRVPQAVVASQARIMMALACLEPESRAMHEDSTHGA